MEHDLSRFILAQEKAYEQALAEIKAGRKTSHWMWYIFPQFRGLGFSETSRYYAIRDIREARDFLAHPVLGARLRQLANELLKLAGSDAGQVFGSPDDLKLRSSMTLFAFVDSSEERPFDQVLEKYFGGRFDEKTMGLLRGEG